MRALGMPKSASSRPSCFSKYGNDLRRLSESLAACLVTAANAASESLRRRLISLSKFSTELTFWRSSLRTASETPTTKCLVPQ